MAILFDLNKIPPKTLFITNVITILLLIIAIGFFIYEINLMKEHGGNCVRNPMLWTENWAWEEKGIRVDCECIRKEGNLSELNLLEENDDNKNFARNRTN